MSIPIRPNSNMNILVDCSWNSWQPWGDCIGHKRKRIRTKEDSSCGGTACVGNPYEYEPCEWECINRAGKVINCCDYSTNKIIDPCCISKQQYCP